MSAQLTIHPNANLNLQGSPKLAITVGEPAGIGPEIALKAIYHYYQNQQNYPSVLIGDATYLTQLAHELGLDLPVHAFSLETILASPNILDFQQPAFYILDCPLKQSVQRGHLNVENAHSILQTLDAAILLTQKNITQAIVTAPLQKSLLCDAGIPFTGHTEYFAEKTLTPKVVMMLAANLTINEKTFPFRVALATTHLPLREVPDAIQFQDLKQRIQIIHADLKKYFGIQQPEIWVAGLNPHAGEAGHLGREEIEVITPVIQALQQDGLKVGGPYPADTMFQQSLLHQADCFVAMYHDQGLSVLKHASFGKGVNITLGLPLIRTSVDHGTALDIARQGLHKADASSMCEAMQIAWDMAQHQLAQSL